MKKLAIVALAGMIAASVFAQSPWKGPDTEAGIIIRYVGASLTNGPYAVVTGTNLFLYEGLLMTNTVCLTSTASVIVGQINAATGAGSTTNAYILPWQAKKWATTGTETCGANKFLTVASNQFEALNVWETNTLVWDSTVVGHYDLALCSMQGASVLGMGNGKLTSIVGDCSITGTITVAVYENEAVRYQKSFAAVIGYYASGFSTDTVTYTTFTTEGDLPADGLHPQTRLGAGAISFIRVTGGLTANTGGIGATME